MTIEEFKPTHYLRLLGRASNSQSLSLRVALDVSDPKCQIVPIQILGDEQLNLEDESAGRYYRVMFLDLNKLREGWLKRENMWMYGAYRKGIVIESSL
jgi:hypothetical protein